MASFYLPGTGRGTATRSVVVEGQTLAAGRDDTGYDAAQAAKNIARWDVEHRETGGSDKGFAIRIALRALSAIVGFAIDFYREMGLQTGKVEAIPAEGMLAAKFEAARPSSKHTPDIDLRGITAAAFFAGA